MVLEKTTILEIIAGLITPDKGELIIQKGYSKQLSVTWKMIQHFLKT